jgi:hypothetical protein
MEKQLTTKQYADLRGISTGAVRKAIKLGHELKGVLRREKFGKSHLFYVSDRWVSVQKRTLKKVA